MKTRVALYGAAGHQIHQLLVAHPHAELVGCCEFSRDKLPVALREDASIRFVNTLDDLLCDASIDLISFCSPTRSEQAMQVIKCLQAGKHAYAEKPCALNERDLDAIMATAARTGKRFHEMASTAFTQPYLAMRELVKQGAIGEVVQVFVQKSYPYYDGRPQDEAVDGGLICQAGVHALRMIEQVAWQPIVDIRATETCTGNPVAGGGLRMASSMMMTLANGAVGAVIANYLNARVGPWGNDHLRIFGTRGFIESVDEGRRTRLVVDDKDLGAIDTSAPSIDYFDLMLAEIQGRGEMPMSLESEVHPTRMSIRAKRDADAPQSSA